MTIKITAAAIVLSLATAGSAFAFDNTIYLDVDGYGHQIDAATFGSGNYHVGTHKGRFNDNHSTLAGTDNASSVYQGGQYNTTDLHVRGFGQQIGTIQENFGNTLEIESYGHFNGIGVVQKGYNDTVRISNSGSGNTIRVTTGN